MDRRASGSAQDASQIPVTGRVLGIDFGTRRIGIAVCDVGQKFSSPLENYQRNGVQADARFFRRIVEDQEPVGMVIGLPLHLSGDESQKSGEARKFAAWLGDVTGLPFEFHDERFTSTMAESILLQTEMTKKQRKARTDKLAAHFILQSWLTNRNKEEESSELPDDRPDDHSADPASFFPDETGSI